MTRPTSHKCQRCLPETPRVVFDRAAGDTICTGCGLVLDERAICYEDNRAIARGSRQEDDEGGTGAKKSNATASSPAIYDTVSAQHLITLSVTYKSSGFATGSRGCDYNDQDYYQDAIRLVNSYFEYHYPDARDRRVETRALAIFDCLFRKQRTEKTQSDGRRQRYSAKWPLLVASIFVAYRELGKPVPVSSIVIRDVNFVQPTEVAVWRVLKTIGWDPSEKDQTLREKARKNKRATAELKRKFLFRPSSPPAPKRRTIATEEKEKR